MDHEVHNVKCATQENQENCLDNYHPDTLGLRSWAEICGGGGRPDPVRISAYG